MRTVKRLTAKQKQKRYRIKLCGKPFGYEGVHGGYLTVLSRHETLGEAMRWGSISGLAAYGEREGQLWIEEVGRPATLEKVWN